MAAAQVELQYQNTRFIEDFLPGYIPSHLFDNLHDFIDPRQRIIIEPQVTFQSRRNIIEWVSAEDAIQTLQLPESADLQSKLYCFNTKQQCDQRKRVISSETTFRIIDPIENELIRKTVKQKLIPRVYTFLSTFGFNSTVVSSDIIGSLATNTFIGDHGTSYLMNGDNSPKKSDFDLLFTFNTAKPPDKLIDLQQNGMAFQDTQICYEKAPDITYRILSGNLDIVLFHPKSQANFTIHKWSIGIEANQDNL